MNENFRLDTNSRKNSQRLLVCTVGLVLLIASGAAGAAPEDSSSVRGVSSIAEASATIVNPTSLRAAELDSAGTDFSQTSGLAVAPAAIVRRDCADDRTKQHCGLIILDLP